MSVIRLTIDDQEAVVPEGSTLLRAAEELGIEIPTLCHLDGLEPTTSCMVCVVHDLQTDRLIPACSMPSSETATPERSATSSKVPSFWFR